jgi:hypothetical protein
MIAARSGEAGPGVETSAMDILGGAGNGGGLSSLSIFSAVHSWALEHRSSVGVVTAPRGCDLTGGPVAKGMTRISYVGYRFPPEIIQQAIWLYLRFTLSAAI